ncbi:uncharacterized protein TNCV_2786401 [Trichonephila clavipes]|nr:uncharacterized protein TNCV_2786401 [Trichonephila clavipes]
MSTEEDLTYAKNVNIHCIYDRLNGNVRAALRMYHTQFSDRRTSGHKIFQRLHRQLREPCSFHVTKHDAGQQRAVRSPSQEESILNVVVVRPESSTKAVAQHISMSHQTVCRVLNENRSHLFHFQRVQTLNPSSYLLRLLVGVTAM